MRKFSVLAWNNPQGIFHVKKAMQKNTCIELPCVSKKGEISEETEKSASLWKIEIGLSLYSFSYCF